MQSDKLNFKFISILIALYILVITAVLCVTSPQMHKPFEISIIKHIIKINSDGNTTLIKQVTTTKVREK